MRCIMRHENADKYVKNKADIPNEPHWAIIKFDKIYIPGDERSHTNPGHGYPSRTETTLNYEVYMTEEKWKSQIVYRESVGERGYVAVKVFPAKVEIEMNAKVSF